MHDNSIQTFHQSYACTLEDATLAQIASLIGQFVSQIKSDQKFSSVHNTDMLSCFFLKTYLMTITQHAHIYNFHTSNLCLKKYFFLNFYQCRPYYEDWSSINKSRERYIRIKDGLLSEGEVQDMKDEENFYDEEPYEERVRSFSWRTTRWLPINAGSRFARQTLSSFVSLR